MYYVISIYAYLFVKSNLINNSYLKLYKIIKTMISYLICNLFKYFILD